MTLLEDAGSGVQASSSNPGHGTGVCCRTTPRNRAGHHCDVSGRLAVIVRASGIGLGVAGIYGESTPSKPHFVRGGVQGGPLVEGGHCCVRQPLRGRWVFTPSGNVCARPLRGLARIGAMPGHLLSGSVGAYDPRLVRGGLRVFSVLVRGGA